MSQPDNLSDFLSDSKPLVKEYLEIRLELARLRIVRLLSQAAGFLVWLLVSLFLILLIAIFSGVVLGCWLGAILHSYVWGFGLTTLGMVVLFILLTAFRKALFVNPVIQAIIRRAREEFQTKSQEPGA
jgi:hypothetical protein